MTFELPCGLPDTPWQVERDGRDGMAWNNHIVDARGNRICFMSHDGTPENSKHEAAARAIASIPDMVEEIERLRERVANLESGMRGFESDCIELAAECEDADISPAERRTYRAFAASARAILAKS